jgi:hypothetical protein
LRWNPATWIVVFGSIGSRLRSLEAVRTTLDDIINDLQIFGLQRLDQAIVPLIEEQQTALANLQQQIAQALQATADLVDQFQEDTATALASLQSQIDAALLVIESNIGSLQAQVDEILAGGLSAENVNETATRVFVSPAQRTQIDTIADTLANFTAATNALLSSYEPKWSKPAAYNAVVPLNHQHIIATSAFTLNLITTTSAVGDRFRITVVGSGFVATLSGAGLRFRNLAGAWVTESFIINKPVVTCEFVKVATTDWEML